MAESVEGKWQCDVTISSLRQLRSSSRRKQYADYAQALNDCTEHGYENADIVNVVVEKTKRYRDNLLLKTPSLQLNATSAYSLCSGTLQCAEPPYDTWQKLISTSANHILFNRLGLTKGNHQVITTHETWTRQSFFAQRLGVFIASFLAAAGNRTCLQA